MKLKQNSLQHTISNVARFKLEFAVSASMARSTASLQASISGCECEPLIKIKIK